MKLIVKGDSEKVKNVLKTNREYKKGSEITGDESLMRGLAQKYPDLFEVHGDPLAEKKPKKARKSKKDSDDKEFKASKNKFLSKGDSFKSKGWLERCWIVIK